MACGQSGAASRLVFVLLPAWMGALAPTVAGAASLQNIAAVTGTCDRLVVDGKDLTAGCSGKLLQSIYADGRTGWYLTHDNNAVVVTFSGMSGPKPDPDSQIQSVDKLIVNLGQKGVPPNTEAVSGECLYSNPYKGPVSVTCIARNEKDAVSVFEFRTDGQPPQFMTKQ